MCGRATVVNRDGIQEKVYGFTRRFLPSDWGPRYNLNPRETIPIVWRLTSSFAPRIRPRV
jgi:hypothetical protein